MEADDTIDPEIVHVGFDALHGAVDGAEKQPSFRSVVVPSPHLTPSGPMSRKQYWAQRLQRFVNWGDCTYCGEQHSRSQCPTRIVPDKPKRHVAGRVKLSQKSMKFATFILSHWRAERLRESGVLDVAGGQGFLSTELALRHRIPCTVIDPRSVVFTPKQLSFHDYLLTHPETGLRDPELPQQLPLLFEDNFLDTPAHLALWQRTGLVVGLHPDEATERIIRLCLQWRKDFAVLPCCVFPRKFVHRRTAEGGPVVHYYDLCEYLRQLDPQIQQMEIDIPGRNIVLWRIFSPEERQ